MASATPSVQGSVICPDGVTRDLRNTKTIDLNESGRGFVYVGKTRVYGTAGPYQLKVGGGGYARTFTPDGKNAHLVQPAPITQVERTLVGAFGQ
jgi:hypothetical protein